MREAQYATYNTRPVIVINHQTGACTTDSTTIGRENFEFFRRQLVLTRNVLNVTNALIVRSPPSVYLIAILFFPCPAGAVCGTESLIVGPLLEGGTAAFTDQSSFLLFGQSCVEQHSFPFRRTYMGLPHRGQDFRGFTLRRSVSWFDVACVSFFWQTRLPVEHIS